MRDLAQLDRQLTLIDVGADLCRAAGRLAEWHALRGYDAVHLATALTLASERLIFATWDRGLARAAGDEGLGVVPDLSSAT